MAEVCGLRRQGVNAIQEGSRCINLGSKCFILVSMRTKNSREERSTFVLQNAPNGLLLLLLVVARNQQIKGCYSDIYICFSREIGHVCWVDCILKFIYFYVTNTWKCFSFFCMLRVEWAFAHVCKRDCRGLRREWITRCPLSFQLFTAAPLVFFVALLFFATKG